MKESLSTRYDAKVTKSVSKELLGTHGITDCDTVSGFSGKEKIKSLELLLNNEIYINSFVKTSKVLDISDATFNILENFVV